MAQKRAEELYQECKEALKSHAAARRSEFTQELKKLYGQLSRKRRILDLPASFSKAGVFRRATSFDRWKHPRLHEDVRLPEGTFPEWPQSPGVTWFSPIKERIETLAPDVPPRILMLIPKSHTLKPYHILWEVESQEAWEETRVPKDPILLKKITLVFWVVIGTWNLTKLERAILRGRL